MFCEKIAFNLDQTEQVFKTAEKHQLKIKCHGEQLSCSDSTVLAAQYQALSVDHLEYASEIGIPEFHGEYSLLGALHRTGGSGDKTLLRRGEFLTNDSR